jgi:hypothetical protein
MVAAKHVAVEHVAQKTAAEEPADCATDAECYIGGQVVSPEATRRSAAPGRKSTCGANTLVGGTDPIVWADGAATMTTNHTRLTPAVLPRQPSRKGRLERMGSS